MASIEYEFNDIFKAFEDQGINWLNRVENMYKQNGLSFPPDFKQRFIYNSFEWLVLFNCHHLEHTNEPKI